MHRSWLVRRWLSTALRGLALIMLAAGSAAITASSLAYFGEELAPFVMEKLPLPLEDIWMRALQIHVVAAAISLPGCALLTLGVVIRRRQLHRWVGRVTAMVALFALVPSGLYLSWFAKGGALATAGFALSGVVVAVGMIQGVRTARARRFVEHRRWVLHVLAQLAVAVASRAMLFAFDAVAFDDHLAYLISLWVPVVAGLALVELLTAKPRTWTALLPRRTHEAPVDTRHPHLLRYDVRRPHAG